MSIISTTKYPLPPVQYANFCAKDQYAKIAYYCWGPESPEATVFCVHGLTGNASNFAFLAEYVMKHQPTWRVVSVDLPGRGKSDWFKTRENYSYPIYTQAILAIYSQVFDPRDKNHKKFYVGTSLGGLIAMFIGSYSSICFDAYCYNDITPLTPSNSVRAVGRFCAVETHFDSTEEAIDYVESRNKVQWGPNTDREMFEYMTLQALQDLGEDYDPSSEVISEEVEVLAKEMGCKVRGRFKFNYDILGIGYQLDDYHDKDGNINLWEHYKKIINPILLLQGKISYLCVQPDVDEMIRLSETTQGPKITVVPFENTGHIIPLYHDSENAIVIDWFAKF